mmetsp:Transcript_42309/g.105740  ORF Transcript_42309/g.105740 Transcript_42309/m.105740 type:complete len:252 (+) Transcript_42309:42-797(+)|eukprot:CAMPEP_0173437710 /NCGR_PEP_ID=MMETSP1357-20121228/18184_1 /TAXON_ID=77926 /ORGANISM="Hemiselmis rufescens, Strain PCC563" /LENGTH=251 /DNA_ID=CAMNT_0014402911 /DNA_START=37 /DNA_END=792 /DNA_ORIENTATION=+
MWGGGYGAIGAQPDPFSPVQAKGGWELETKRAFLVKVYSIVSVQLAVTVLFCGVSMYVEPVRLGLLSVGPLMGWVLLIPMIGLLFALHWKKNSYPLNMWLLGCFTVVESLLVGFVCAAHQQAGEDCVSHGLHSCAGMGTIVWYAWAATFVVFGSLTAFVMFSGIDFSFLGLFLFAGSIIMIGWALVSMIFGLHTGFFFGACGAALMCGYILYDTSNIMKRMGPDDYVIAAIEIYIDVITLFLYILEMMSSD